MDLINNYYNLIIENAALKALALAFVSIVVAKIVDIVFTLVFKKIVKKTKTSLDDRLSLIHI